MFGKDEFIFSAKNGIAIVLSVLEIHNLYSLRRVGPIPSSLENKYIFVAPRFHVKISKCTINFVLHFAIVLHFAVRKALPFIHLT